MGLMHCALIEDSERLQIIENMFKQADHPLSAQEISIGAYPNSFPQKVMLNVSTYIGEMRGRENRDRGHIVSFATTWKQAAMGQIPGVRTNADGTATVFLERATLPWHDGRPRYYLIAAPGWRPRWYIGDTGLLVPSAGPLRNAECGMRNEDRGGSAASEVQSTIRNPKSEMLLCANPDCRKPIQRTPEDPLKNTCDEACFTAWRDSLRQKVGLF